MEDMLTIMEPSISFKPFGKTAEGQEVMLYSLSNKNGMRVDITNYGGIIVRLFVPDRRGRLADVVLGFNSLKEYNDSPYFGALIGRYGNRIADAKFNLEGKEYRLAVNEKPGGKSCNLHGGFKGFDKVIWDAEPVIANGIPGLKLHYLSKDGEEGFPGNLEVHVNYWLTAKNTLRVEYRATTDKATPVNLTQHSYFNLKGEGVDDILEHILTIYGEYFTPIDKGMIPTGEIKKVKGSPFDFTSPVEIGLKINAEDEQLKIAGGYDHNWVLSESKNELRLAARVYEPFTGRQLEVLTTEPGLQFYSGNFLTGELKGKSGRPYIHRSGLCLETQHYPNSPNEDKFPSTILRPGEEYYTVTDFRFSVS